jgi:hypothetical protein
MSIFSAELRVTARKLTAMAHNLCRVAGQMNPVLTGTLEGALPDDGITVHYSTSASISSATGRYAIEPVLSGPQSKLENYSVNLVPGALIVVPPIRMSGSNLVCVLGSGPAPVDEQVSVENSPGFDFEGMQLTVTVAAPEAGSIEARSASDNTNGLKISDGRLLFKGSVFGSADNNAGPDSVQFTFTAGAIAPAVEALLQALVFSTDTYGSGSRVIEITISFGESHVRYVRGVEINRPPVAEPDTILAVANTSFMITEDELLGNDLDSDGDVLTLRPGVSVGTNGATLTIGSGMLAYTPGPKQDAEEEFSCTVEDGRGASCLVTVKFRFIQRHRIIMSSADVDDHGTRVFMAGTPEGEYDIEASADLANWRPIDTLKASSTGIIEVRDSQSAGLPQRFYRAVAK